MPYTCIYDVVHSNIFLINAGNDYNPNSCFWQLISELEGKTFMGERETKKSHEGQNYKCGPGHLCEHMEGTLHTKENIFLQIASRNLI